MAQLSGQGPSGPSTLSTSAEFGVWGDDHGLAAPPFGSGVVGTSDLGFGVSGTSRSREGVIGGSQGQGRDESNGVFGYGYGTGVVGVDENVAPQGGIGVKGESTSGDGVWGQSEDGVGVAGWSGRNDGVFGATSGQPRGNYDVAGVRGINDYSASELEYLWGDPTGASGMRILDCPGVAGISLSGYGVLGVTFGRGGYSSNAGVAGRGPIGVYGTTTVGDGGFAALFDGLVVCDSLWKASGGFRVDHPLEPTKKYLQHSFVESPDMKNIYDGVVVVDANGEAVVELPKWFETLNRDLRYQLTPIGAPGPNLHIAEELAHSRFKIAGGSKGMKVSWQVTGIRKDAWANAHRIVAEEDKKGVELGKYLHPELFGEPKERRKRAAVEEEKGKLERGLNVIEKSRRRMADGRQQAEKHRLRISEHMQNAKE